MCLKETIINYKNGMIYIYVTVTYVLFAVMLNLKS